VSTQESTPRCECHGELMLWNADATKTKGGSWRCRVKRNEAQTRHRQANPERTAAAKRRWRLAQLGTTPEEYDLMLEEQDGLCAVGCGRPASRVDHCHETGELRQLLCHCCNVGLGHFLDDPALLRSAAAYVERHAA